MKKCTLDKKIRTLEKRIVNMLLTLCIVSIAAAISVGIAFGADLDGVKKAGVLRHLGVPYANFVTGVGDGMDVELMRLFAKHIGVKYEYVKTDWDNIFADLTGKKVVPKGSDIEITGESPVRGDIAANGITILPWRQKIVDFSTPTFPNQVWLISRSDSPLKPIKPTGDIDKDIAAVKKLLKDRTLLGKAKTCLDPSLYNIDITGAKVRLFNGTLNELAPAVINGESELTLLDIPDALVALQKWPGKIKVIGPISEKQFMGAAFSKDSPKLRAAFNKFMDEIKR
ncbi:MAG TPA: transporter substrate-binding domain-containing protein, partial [Dissulfurispiraceae bacterium]|nr:transporter substrate-binding domain-containing protein [Dissulfurispiraceae bacterium]